jgi:hypothetical protein
MRASAFFPPSLNPVLDRDPRDKHPVISPEVPTGGLVGQAVFDHQTDRQSHNAVGVVALGQGHVRHIGVEVEVTSGAIMDGVRKMGSSD